MKAFMQGFSSNINMRVVSMGEGVHQRRSVGGGISLAPQSRMQPRLSATSRIELEQGLLFRVLKISFNSGVYLPLLPFADLVVGYGFAGLIFEELPIVGTET